MGATIFSLSITMPSEAQELTRGLRRRDPDLLEQLIEQYHAGKIARRNVFDLDREIDEIADFGYIAGGGFLNEQRPRCRNRPVHPNQV